MTASHIALHLHTEFSLLDGASRVEDICQKARELGMPGIALTDHGTMFGAFKFYHEAKKNGIKPIIGCEVYVINGDHTLKGKENKLKLYHLVLLAKNDIGYKNLIKIVSESCINGFYYKPRISKEFLKQYSEGLIALSACLGGEVNNLLLNHNDEQARISALEYKEIFGEDFYLEVQDHFYPEDRIVNPKMIKLSKDLGIKVVATNDSHYTNKEDAIAHDALLCLQTQKYISDFPRMRFSPHQYLKSQQEMLELFQDHLDPETIEQIVIHNPSEILDKVSDYESFKNPATHLPDPQVPEGYTDETYLKEITYQGALKRFGQISDEVRSRIDFELDVMNNSGFAAYFIVVWDFINWARQQGIPVGPGRGSAAGSMVAYALGITNIDPLKYDLLFERFLNPERKSMPDIDTDFCIDRREEVIEYVRKKYGQTNVCQIITFNRLTSRAVLKDMARVLEYPYAKAEDLAKLIPVVRGKPRSIDWMIENHDEFSKKYKGDPEAREVIDLAVRNEGINKTFGVHAAGVIISDQAIDQIIPISKSNDGAIITQFAMEECASMGLLKMDFLGLRNLTMIKNAIDIISLNSGLGKEKINIDEISLEDPATFDTICSGNLSGIFQLETSSGMRQIARDLAPRSLEDISALIALYRPGPLDTGMIDDFIARKSGKKPITYDHPLLEIILKNTYGTIVYQEQIMQITQVLAGFTLGEADLLRRAMGKKKPEVLLPYKDKFIEGCTNNPHPQAISKELSEKLFEQMLAFAEYCFNKSHSTAYGFVTYQTAYLKTHYPVEYLTSLFMSANGDTDRIKTYIIEATRLAIKVTPPNINLSEQDFSTKDGKIFFGLKAIKGVGDTPSQAIIQERNRGGAFKDFWDFCSRVDHKVVNKKTLESLIKCGAFDGMGAGRKAMIENLESFTGSAKRFSEQKANGQFSLFALADSETQLASPIYNNGADDEYPERELQAMEYELLGLYVNNHPMQGIQTILETVSCHDIKSLEDKPDGAKVSVAVLITDFVKKITKAKKSICILNLEDMESRIEGVLFSRQLNDYEQFIEKGKRVLIKGTISKRLEGDSSIMVESIEDLDALGTIDLNLDVDKLNDYYQFFHALKSLMTRSEHQGSKILILHLHSSSGPVRKLSCGPKFTISDSIITRDAIQALINRFSSEILAGVSA